MRHGNRILLCEEAKPTLNPTVETTLCLNRWQISAGAQSFPIAVHRFVDVRDVALTCTFKRLKFLQLVENTS
ncbi:hypothetical protein TorRG33x02_344310 [Trema orientale]|uniref:Uncharacterized protein n=1 Tax=Trema orientale TaxID=63057 RepID=A0A2P5AQF7_TREOI|nr:hypothetical protein TorRG33x02_344310 [Trema orientale]